MGKVVSKYCSVHTPCFDTAREVVDGRAEPVSVIRAHGAVRVNPSGATGSEIRLQQRI